METVSFTKMENGTKEEYAFLKQLYIQCIDGIPEMLLGLLKRMQGDRLGYQIDRYQHSLQTATRAERDGSDEETIVCALLHDIGDVLAPDNHSQVAAAILQPYISERNYWVLKHHGLFQGYYYFHHINKTATSGIISRITNFIKRVLISVPNGINVHLIRITTPCL